MALPLHMVKAGYYLLSQSVSPCQMRSKAVFAHSELADGRVAQEGPRLAG